MVRSTRLMEKCFELAGEAKERGDTAVGSLIITENGEIIAEAGEQNNSRDLFAHSELLVIQEAVKIRRSNDLSGCTLFSTHEPCFLCSFAIRQTSISRVIFARSTPQIGGVSSRYPILAATDIETWGRPPEIVFAHSKGKSLPNLDNHRTSRKNVYVTR